ncbi:MAG: hypothetical protein LW850_15385 [Planctomycetaceae bacterium]|nr:hypothetical protein [Planctomycetaceae bacterium]
MLKIPALATIGKIHKTRTPGARWNTLRISIGNHRIGHAAYFGECSSAGIFSKIHYRKIHYRKIHYRKIHYRKILP